MKMVMNLLFSIETLMLKDGDSTVHALLYFVVNSVGSEGNVPLCKLCHPPPALHVHTSEIYQF